MDEKKWLNRFAQQLNECMKQTNMSHTDMAKLLGVSRPTITRYSNGLRMPTAYAMYKLRFIYPIYFANL